MSEPPSSADAAPAGGSRSLSARRARLHDERERLRRRSVQLRERIAYDAQALNPALKAADTARGVGDWVRANPHYLFGGALTALVALAVARPRRVLSLGMRLWGGWRVVRPLLPLIRLLADGRRR